LLGRLGAVPDASGFVPPEALDRARALGAGLLQAMASGEAFQATWRNLALWGLAALVVVLAMKNVKAAGPASPH
jgi:hypothetical protein